MESITPDTTNSAEIKIAKLYIFLLPFRMIAPLSFIKDIIGPLANYTDTVVLFIGLLLWIGNAGGMKISSINLPLYRTIRNSVFVLNISSFVMAFVMFYLYGDCNDKSPFLGIVPMILFYFQYLLMFIYNIRVFQLLDYRTIIRILTKSCSVLLVIGYIQVLVLLGIGTSVYDFLAKIIGGFVPSSFFYKLPLTASEGAGAGSIIGILVLPFLFARYLHGDKKSLRQLILWLIPLYYTHSSTAYLLFMLDLGIFVYLLLCQMKKTGHIVKVLPLVIVGCLIVSAVVIGGNKFGLADELAYVTIDKASDLENGSTVARMVPFIINWGCFTEMPIAGVGNGLQGYFFSKYFPYEFLSVPGTDLGGFLQRATESGTIANGGTFLPGYLSGYGILGILILIAVIKKLRKTFKSRSSHLGLFREMFIIGSWAFLITALSSEMYCLYFAWFVLSIPFMYFDFNEKSKTSSNYQRSY